MTAEQAAPCQCDNRAGERCAANHHGNQEKGEELASISLSLSPPLLLSLFPLDCEPQPARQQQRSGKRKGSQLAAQRVSHVVGYQ